MINCTSCKSSDAILILTSIQCPNPKCDYYDEDWAEEITKRTNSFNKKALSRAAKSIKQGTKKIKYSIPW